MLKHIVYITTAVLLAGVQQGITQITLTRYAIPLLTLSDAQYPDNNNIGYRSSYYNVFQHDTLILEELSNGNFNIIITPKDSTGDTAYINNFNLSEMIPTIPEHVQSDTYLSHLAVLNQEWNRIQVRFPRKYYFSQKGKGNEAAITTRIDIANNCLSATLWEMQMYALESNRERVYFQCWLSVPEDVYKRLFEKRNLVSYDAWKHVLTVYEVPPSQKINFNMLRTLISQTEAAYKNLNTELYPFISEQQTKAKNIIYPTTFTSINDLLTDATSFASFVPPGKYDRRDVRNTSLSALKHPQKIIWSSTVSTNAENTKAHEITIEFLPEGHTQKMKLTIGGLQLQRIPILPVSNYSGALQLSAGIANHYFSNSFTELFGFSSKRSPYYLLLTDENERYIDSHVLGIDGVLLFIDTQDHTQLHVYILAFERHTFAGHFVITIPEQQAED